MYDIEQIMPLTANQAWAHSLDYVFSEGKEVTPKGIKTKECLNESILFDMNNPICYHQHRKLSYTFMAAEAYWINSGSMFTDDIIPYNKHIAQFSDDNHIFNGAYGPKFLNQLMYVVYTLEKDASSRQAVMTIWHPNPVRTKDYACTVCLQFLIRENKLNTIVTMRSNDLWLGRPYDVFNFTIMSLRVLTMLNADFKDTFRPLYSLGWLALNVGSAHIYESDFEKVQKVYQTLPDKHAQKVPNEALTDWKFIVDSLLACRDKKSTKGLWKIRP